MSSISSVFYAESYHPIQAGSIDGTDILPHDNAVFRAHLCSSASLYDPFGDPNAVGDPCCTLFVARLSHQTTEHILHKAMSKYGRVKNLRLVRHIVTGASRGYAFVEFETEREMRCAYKDSHHSIIDDCEIMVDYNRQQLMPGWIPRRLGGGFGGKKESGQLRFGGRERPFRAPLRPIPYDELKKLGIPPPPEGKYMSRYQDPSPPRKEKGSEYREEEGCSRIGSAESYGRYRKRSPDCREGNQHMKRREAKTIKREEKSSIKREEESAMKREMKSSIKREEESTMKREVKSYIKHEEKSDIKREEHSKRVSIDRDGDYTARSSMERDRSSSVSIERSEHYKYRRSRDKDELPHKRGYKDGDEKRPNRRHKSRHHDRSHATANETEDTLY